jgi:hypothetical protein
MLKIIVAIRSIEYFRAGRQKGILLPRLLGRWVRCSRALRVSILRTCERHKCANEASNAAKSTADRGLVVIHAIECAAPGEFTCVSEDFLGVGPG